MKRTNEENVIDFIYSALAMLSQHSGSVALMNTFIRSIPYVKARLL
jgi:hypothetical protein